MYNPEYQKSYYLKNREKFIENAVKQRLSGYSKKYYQEHKETMKRQSAKFLKDYFPRKRRELIEILGNKCIRCGFDDIRALQLDHINGGGLKEFKLIGNTQMYIKYHKNKDKLKQNLQVLCANCNWIKRYENNEVRNG